MTIRVQRKFGIATAELVYEGFLQLWHVGERKSEVVSKKNAVALLVYNRDRRQVLLVEQHRPAAEGWVVEAMAGHIEECPSGMDPKLWAVETMAREANEEMGATIDPGNIELLNTCPLYSSPGFTTEKIWLGYVEIGDADIEQKERIFGLEQEHERIQRIWLTPEHLTECYNGGAINDMKTFALVLWFLLNKYPQLKEGGE